MWSRSNSFSIESLCNDLFKNKVYLPTSHNTPIITALQSCRNIDSSKFINYLNNLNITNKVTDDNGVFIKPICIRIYGIKPVGVSVHSVSGGFFPVCFISGW